MLAESRIHKAIAACQQALELLDKDEKRLAVGQLDHAKEYVLASIYLTIAEVEEEDGQF